MGSNGRRGAPASGLHLVCVADADVIVNGLGLSIDASVERGSDAWVEAVNAAFTERLRAAAAVDGDRVHGIAIRWSYESLVLAGFDDPHALQKLAGVDAVDEVKRKAFLAACTPADPSSTPDAEFTETFDDPQRCLKRLAADQGWAPLKKGDPRKDDAVDVLSRSALPKLTARVPDLQRLGDLLSSL